jgi:hypothetical protein
MGSSCAPKDCHCSHDPDEVADLAAGLPKPLSESVIRHHLFDGLRNRRIKPAVSRAAITEWTRKRKVHPTFVWVDSLLGGFQALP